MLLRRAATTNFFHTKAFFNALFDVDCTSIDVIEPSALRTDPGCLDGWRPSFPVQVERFTIAVALTGEDMCPSGGGLDFSRKAFVFPLRIPFRLYSIQFNASFGRNCRFSHNRWSSANLQTFPEKIKTMLQFKKICQI